MARQTSKPLRSGSIRSSSTTSGRSCAEPLQRLGPAQGRLGAVAAQPHEHREQRVGVRLVFDDQGGRHRAVPRSDRHRRECLAWPPDFVPSYYEVAGSDSEGFPVGVALARQSMVMVVPRPGSLSAQTRPPCSSTNFLTRLKPRPSPRFWKPKSPEEWPAGSNSVKNGSKTRARALGSIADAVVDHPKPDRVGAAAPRHQLDQAAVGRELDGVGQQVDQRIADLVAVETQGPGDGS